MFEGTVVDQRAVVTNVCDMTTIAIDYEVSVTRMWKGTPSQTVDVLRRGPCDPSFRVGTPYVIYAGTDERNRLVMARCTLTGPADAAGADVGELGTPIAVFDRTIIDIPGSMPVTRRARAYVVAGLGKYLSMFLDDYEWRDVLLSGEAAWLAVVILQVCLGAVYRIRRRPKVGALLIGAAVPTTFFAIIWSGRRLLENEWFAPFLMWWLGTLALAAPGDCAMCPSREECTHGSSVRTEWSAARRIAVDVLSEANVQSLCGLVPIVRATS